MSGMPCSRLHVSGARRLFHANTDQLQWSTLIRTLLSSTYSGVVEVLLDADDEAVADPGKCPGSVGKFRSDCVLVCVCVCACVCVHVCVCVCA